MHKTINRYLLTFMLMLSTPSWLCAQTDELTDYLVTQTADTLFGKVEYINENAFGSGFYKKIRIRLTNGKKKKFARKKVSSFSIDGAIYQQFWLSQAEQEFPKLTLSPNYVINQEDGDLYFLKRHEIGPLSHYELEWFDDDNDTLWSMSLLRKAGDDVFVRADQGLFGLKRKKLIKYFTNCEVIIDALDQKSLKTVDEVVKFYNWACIH